MTDDGRTMSVVFCNHDHVTCLHYAKVASFLDDRGIKYDYAVKKGSPEEDCVRKKCVGKMIGHKFPRPHYPLVVVWIDAENVGISVQEPNVVNMAECLHYLLTGRR